MTVQDIKCFSCDGSARLVREPVDFELGRRIARVEVEHYLCELCGETFYSPQQADAAQRAAAEELRRQEGLLSPSAIKEIRTYLKLTQAELERVLGVGPKTVVRWERGTVFQNRATDRLLRVISQVPAAFDFLAKTSGVRAHGAVETGSCSVLRFKPKTVSLPVEAEPQMPAFTKEALK